MNLEQFIQQEQERHDEQFPDNYCQRVSALELRKQCKSFLKESHSRLLEKVRESVGGMKLGGHRDEEKRIYAGGYDQCVDEVLSLLTPPDTK